MKINSVFPVTILSLVLVFSAGEQTLSAASQKTASSSSISSVQKRLAQRKASVTSTSASSRVRTNSATPALSTAQQRLLLRKQAGISSSSARSVSRSSSSSAPSITNTELDMGIEIHKINDRFFVYSMKKDSYALQSELDLGDEIIAIDGKELKSNITVAAVAQMLNGPEGSESTLKIGRINKGYMTITFRRERKKDLPVALASTMSGIGILTINSLNAQAMPLIRKACQELYDKGNLKGVVIDLHTNPNGVLEGVGKLVSCFVPQNTTYITMTNYPMMVSSRQDIPYVTKDKPIFAAGTKIVLLTRYSLSPATVVAAMSLTKSVKAKLLYIDAINTKSVSTPITMLGPDGKEQELLRDSTLTLDAKDGLTMSDRIILNGALTDAEGLQAAVNHALHN